MAVHWRDRRALGAVVQSRGPGERKIVPAARAAVDLQAAHWEWLVLLWAAVAATGALEWRYFD